MLNFRAFRKRRDSGISIIFTLFVLASLGILFAYRQVLADRDIKYQTVFIILYSVIQLLWLFTQAKPLYGFAEVFKTLPVEKRSMNIAAILYQVSKSAGVALLFLFYAILYSSIPLYLLATFFCLLIAIPVLFGFWIPKFRQKKIIAKRPLWFNLVTFYCSPWLVCLIYSLCVIILRFTGLSAEGRLGGRLDGTLIMIDFFAAFATLLDANRNWRNARYLLYFPVSFPRWQLNYYKAAFFSMLVPRVLATLALLHMGLNPWRFLVAGMASSLIMSSLLAPPVWLIAVTAFMLGYSPFSTYFFVGGLNWAPIAWLVILIIGLAVSRRDHSMVACLSVSEGDRLARV